MTVRPRHRKDVDPTPVTLSVASDSRTGTTMGPSSDDASLAPQGSSTATTAVRTLADWKSPALAR